VFKNGIIFQVSWKMILSLEEPNRKQRARDVQMDQLNSALKALQASQQKKSIVIF